MTKETDPKQYVEVSHPDFEYNGVILRQQFDAGEGMAKKGWKIVGEVDDLAPARSDVIAPSLRPGTSTSPPRARKSPAERKTTKARKSAASSSTTEGTTSG